MKSVNTQEMKLIDALASSKFGISSLTLMENAGKGAAALVYDGWQRILIFCGKGNNGGDGFVVARYLKHLDMDVFVCLLCDPDELSGDAKTHFDLAVNAGASIIQIKLTAPINFIGFEDFDLIIDAIFGIGLTRDVSGIHKNAIEWINRTGKPVLSLDIPSGLNADTGEVLGAAVKATETAAMGLPKLGFYKGLGPQYCGKIHIVDIGLPKELLQGLTP